MNVLKNLLLVSFSISFLFAQAQDVDSMKKKSVLTISGSADVYYKYDFAKSNENSFTSFTKSHNQFSLGMASVKLEHAGKKVSAVLDLGFGDGAREFSYNDEGIVQAIKQLYISYAPIESVRFTVGSWATHVGYELVDAQLNRNYSRSYMFSNGPFSHTGIKADFTKDAHGLMLGIANPTDYRWVPEHKMNKKSIIAQYSYTASDRLKLYLNYVGGQNPDTSKVHQFDLVATSKLNEHFSLALNSTISNVQLWTGSNNAPSKSWWGAALYLNYDPKEWFGVTWRSEYFNDKNHLKLLSAGKHIVSHTLSANFKKGGFLFIPELRYDVTDENGLFKNKNGLANKKDWSFLFAAIYSF